MGALAVIVVIIIAFVCYRKRKMSSRKTVRLYITKTRLFQYTENFTTKKGKFQIKKNTDIFHIPA